MKSVVKVTGRKEEQFNLSSFEDCLINTELADLCHREDEDLESGFPYQKDKDRRRQVNEIVRKPHVLQRLSLLMNIH
jgi:hypothetical protein